MTSVIYSTVSRVNSVAGLVGLLVATLGLIIVIFGSLDIKHVATKLYEMGKDWPVGFWVASRDAKQFRAWLVFLGAFFILCGTLLAIKVGHY